MPAPEAAAENRLPETTETDEVIRRFRQDISGGRHWYLALLQAVGRWETAEEIVSGRKWRYIISGEAFDWLLLAERLCRAAGDLVPENEKRTLLFNNKPPLDIPSDEFRRLFGEFRYNQHLNYYYGIIVEEAVISAVEEEVRKERWTSGYYRDRDNTPEAFRRIYGFTKAVMLNRFRKEKGYSQLASIRLDELKEFSYWLFKYRLKQSDKARMASDTRKGLDWLRSKAASRNTGNPGTGSVIIDIPSY